MARVAKGTAARNLDDQVSGFRRQRNAVLAVVISDGLGGTPTP